MASSHSSGAPPTPLWQRAGIGALTAAIGAVLLFVLTTADDSLLTRADSADSADSANREPAAALLASRALRFDPPGASAPGATPDPAAELRVLDADSGEVLQYVPANDASFVRGILRGLNFERGKLGVDPAAPYRLSRWDDGMLALDDPHTGERIELVAFGPTNVQAFARLLYAGDAVTD